MTIKLNQDFKLNISKDEIKIRKGIWNFLDIKIKQDDYSPKEFKEILQNFQDLLKNKQLSFKDENYPQVFKDLLLYNVVYQEEQNQDPIDLIVASQPNKINIYPNIPKIEFNQLNDQKINQHKNIMFIFSDYNFEQMKKINHDMRKIQKNHSFIILDGDFIHLIAFNDVDKPCFECFHHRITARLDDYQDLDGISQYSSEINENNTHEIYLLLSLVKIIEANFKRYNYNPLNGRVFSLYKPTLELQFDKILKISLCQECGFSSRRESLELNINLAKAINEIV